MLHSSWLYGTLVHLPLPSISCKIVAPKHLPALVQTPGTVRVNAVMFKNTVQGFWALSLKRPNSLSMFAIPSMSLAVSYIHTEESNEYGLFFVFFDVFY